MNEPPASPGATSIAVRLGGDLVRISAPDTLIGSIERMLVDEAVANPASVDVEIVVDRSEAIRVDGRLWESEGVLGVCDNLMYVLMRTALDREPERLHLHAGLVAADAGSILIAGLAGSGKSTLVADLVAGGLRYFTDERVGIDDDLTPSALHKPISVVSGSFEHLAGLNPALTASGAASDRIWHIPASEIVPPMPSEATASRSPSGDLLPRLASIVFSEFRPGAPPTCEVMHPATATRLLLSDALDVDRYGPGALLLVARLCASVPCWSMVHGGGRLAVEAVRATLSAHEQPRAVRPIPPGSRPAWKQPISVTRSSTLGVAARTTGVCVGDRAVLRTAGGDVVELDEVFSAWLLLLDGRTSVGQLVDEVAAANNLDPAALLPTVSASLAHLAALGVAS